MGLFQERVMSTAVLQGDAQVWVGLFSASLCFSGAACWAISRRSTEKKGFVKAVHDDV